MPAVDIYSATSADALGLEELDLYHLLMEYRVANSLAEIPLSASLTTTAGRHSLDTLYNIWDAGLQLPAGANLHSWSDAPYFADHSQPQVMWDAPERLGTPYTASGFEISAAGYLTIADALVGWQGSAGHNDVILNQGIWAPYEFNAIGVGVEHDPAVSTYGGNIYHVWFGFAADPGGVPDILGTAAGDVFAGTSFEDRMFGLDGADTMDGAAGDDTLMGGANDDTLLGGPGNDSLSGDDGGDLLSGGDALDPAMLADIALDHLALIDDFMFI